jgi:hypothetical protein
MERRRCCSKGAGFKMGAFEIPSILSGKITLIKQADFFRPPNLFQSFMVKFRYHRGFIGEPAEGIRTGDQYNISPGREFAGVDKTFYGRGVFLNQIPMFHFFVIAVVKDTQNFFMQRGVIGPHVFGKDDLFGYHFFIYKLQDKLNRWYIFGDCQINTGYIPGNRETGIGNHNGMAMTEFGD